MPRSRMKFRSIRGPNWVDASVKVTIVIEKTMPDDGDDGRRDRCEYLSSGIGACR